MGGYGWRGGIEMIKFGFSHNIIEISAPDLQDAIKQFHQQTNNKYRHKMDQIDVTVISRKNDGEDKL